MNKCKHCGFDYENNHNWEHPELCCDCYDLSWGRSLKDVNLYRKNRGELPIAKEWPHKQV